MKIKKHLQHILGFLILTIFIVYLWKQRESLLSSLDASWYQIFGIAICVIITWILNSIQAYFLIKDQCDSIGFWETYWVLAASVFANFLPFRAGTIFRIHYFKTVHGLLYAHSLSVIGIRVVIVLCISGLAGVLGVAGIYASTGYFSLEMIVCCAAMILISCIAYFFPPPRSLDPKGFISRVWTDFANGFAALREMPSTTVKVGAVAILQMVFMAIRIWISLDILDVHPTPYVLFALAPLSVLSLYIALTPGGLGIREGIMGYIMLASGYDFSTGIFAGTVDRAVQMILAFLCGIVGFIYSWKNLRKAKAAKKAGNDQSL